MGLFSSLFGGNVRAAAKSTADLFFEGRQLYGSNEAAYRYTYIFRNNTITRNAQYPRDHLVSEMFRSGEIGNCTYITVGNLNTGAAPVHTHFMETFASFHEEISNYLRGFGIPEQYVSGDNRGSTAHIAQFLSKQPIVPPEMWEPLILRKS